jgi:choline/glycine/proline betaine transport protein
MERLAERLGLKTEPRIFFWSAGLMIAFLIVLIAFTGGLREAFGEGREWIVANLGWFFILGVSVWLGFLFWLALSRYGRIRVGGDDARPAYSNVSWFTMLFAGGIGTILMFWGVAEPIFHFAGAPRVDSNTAEAASDAMLLSFHHWGLGAWGVYAVLGLSLAYFGYRHNLPMTVRSALYPLIGNRMEGWAGNTVDILAIFGTMFGIATSLGLGVMQISAGLNSVFDVPTGTGTQVILIAVITLAATISVVTGIDKGIRRLSEVNITLAGLLLLFVAIAGPTLLVISAYFENLGGYVTNFVEVLFWSGSYDADEQGWLSAWTIFYWAWWISWAPFVGTFIARISRGRTIREFVLGVLLVPSLVSFLWFTVMGNTAMAFQDDGTADIYGAIEAADWDESVAMFTMLEALPWTTLVSLVLIFVITVFFVTSSDSGSFVIDMIASGGSLHPPVGMRVFWAVSEGVVAAVLLGAGGIMALRSGAIVTGLPFTLVLLIAAVGVMKGLRSEQPGVTLDDVVAAPLIEGEADRHDARTSQPTKRSGERVGDNPDEPA